MNAGPQSVCRRAPAQRWQRLLRRAVHRLLPRQALLAPGLGRLLAVGESHRHMVDNIGGLEIEYGLGSVIGELLFLQGAFEEGEAAFIERRLQHHAEAVVIDVGANIGLHSLRAARLAGVHRVFAFEPAEGTFAVLERNIARNGLKGKITACPQAVSARAGRATFHVCADDAYSSLRPDGRKPVQQTYEVELTTLDQWSREIALERVDFIKVDVEGSEADVIAGARQVLGRHHPELLVEIFQGNRPDFSAPELIENIRALGYDAYVLIEGEAIPFERHDDRRFNYYFSPSDKIIPP